MTVIRDWLHNRSELGKCSQSLKNVIDLTGFHPHLSIAPYKGTSCERASCVRSSYWFETKSICSVQFIQ